MRGRLCIFALILACLWFGGAVATVQAIDDTPDVTPILVPGNPTCEELGYAYGYKPQPEPPPSGTYAFPGISKFVTIDSNGTYFSWTSTLGVDAVIVKGGPQANVYQYGPAESFGDGGLVSPVNASGGPAGLSHIDFCYDFELAATKTANTQYTRTYTWDIIKEAAPTSLAGFPGNSFTSGYVVTVDQTVEDSAFAVVGEIAVENPSPFVVDFSVSDLVDGTAAVVNCPTYTLAANASTTCTYSAALGAKADVVNIAAITSLTAGVGGATASAPYTFGDPTTVVGYPAVNVSDSVQGDLGEASGDASFTYSRTFACPSDPAAYKAGVYTELFPNVATIDETGQSDDAAVHLECYAPVVSKTAATSFTRTWTWDIDKVGDQDELTLSTGQTFNVNYGVTVKAASADSKYGVSGSISVYNPSDQPMTVNVADSLDDSTAAIVDCGGSASLTVAGKDTGICTYTAAPAGDDATLNTATAIINNIGFTGTAAVDFGSAAISQVDECIAVTDDKAGDLGTVCADQQPKTFPYTLPVGPYAVCGDYAYTNTAGFTANDSGATGSSAWTVNAHIPCGGGCTLTQGYWKTHSKYGPAPYDDTWAQIGEDTVFYLSGQGWYQVLWTPPKGNAYYNLAHQYIAARLNGLNGASSTAAVDAAFSGALNFFSTKSPSASLTKQQRAQVSQWASVLDGYNNGLAGPGHCDDDSLARVSGVGVAGAGLYLPLINQ